MRRSIVSVGSGFIAGVLFCLAFNVEHRYFVGYVKGAESSWRDNNGCWEDGSCAIGPISWHIPFKGDYSWGWYFQREE